jgi:hypothetical protein
VSTQLSLQKVCPLGQAQAPALQVCPPVQALPQLPQLAMLLVVSAHVPLHSVCPAGHSQLP